MTDQDLSPQQQAMVEIWERHMAAEFKTKDIDATMATMTSDPYVNHVPVMTGGVGYNEVRHFYNTYFIPCQPPDTDFVPVSRTVGKDRIVDELIHKLPTRSRRRGCFLASGPRASVSKFPSS